MMTVSIIVPIFHGEQYLPGMLEQIEQCVRNAEHAEVELILYNDAPDETLQVCREGYSYQIRVFNPGYNSGIHGARVQGLEYAAGEYVLFLDQDDRISPLYIKKQLDCIGGADAAVCRAIHNNRLHYTDTHVFEEVISKEFMLKKWCPIVSPGQVLLRKNSIPQLWKEKRIRQNGADDYFLWLLMAGEGKQFSLDQEVLFEHVATGMNTSGDTNRMMDSEAEMIQILKEAHVFEGEDEELLMKLPESLRKIHIKELDTYKNISLFLQNWNDRLANGISPMKFFSKNNIKKLAIYGAGDFGKNIELLLKPTDVEVCFYIDQNAKYILSQLPVYSKEKIQEDVDAVIITAGGKAVKEEMKRLTKWLVFEPQDIWK